MKKQNLLKLINFNAIGKSLIFNISLFWTYLILYCLNLFFPDKFTIFLTSITKYIIFYLKLTMNTSNFSWRKNLKKTFFLSPAHNQCLKLCIAILRPIFILKRAFVSFGWYLRKTIIAIIRETTTKNLNFLIK